MKKLESGTVVMTAGVNSLVADNSEFAKFIMTSLERHSSGDWGDLDPQDKKANDDALISGNRILSAYNGVKKIWIITEADRSATTVLFPSEY